MTLKPWDHGKPPVVCLDFDGVIHDYRDGWQGPEPKGTIVDGAMHAMIKLKQAGARVEIFSTRPKENIQAWLKANAIEDLVDVVRDGKPYYIAFFDDRAHNVPSSQPHGLDDAVDAWLKTQRTVRQ